MATEIRPIPTIARRALESLSARYQRDLNEACAETLEAMGLSPDKGWRVDVRTFVATRDVQEPT